MLETGKATLYLVGDGSPTNPYKVTNWPGSLNLKVTSVGKGKHNWARVRYDVWFNVPNDDKVWWGVSYGDNTQICHAKRTKEDKF